MSQEQNQTQKNQEQDVNQLLKVRREKLAALQAAGKVLLVADGYGN